jgi:hypothetical protein
MVAPITHICESSYAPFISFKLLPAITNFQAIQFISNILTILTGSTPQRRLSHNSIFSESISLEPKGVVWRKKTSMAIKVIDLLPEFKTKTIRILVAYETSQISVNAPFRENTIGQEIMD